ncbi:MAG: PD-(D/E)XK nuclease family protein [Promethearchaeota archaeon]
MLLTKEDLNGLPLHASQVSYFECKRKIVLYILCLAKDIKIQINDNKHLLAGNVLHTILQDTFRWYNFPLVEYYYYNESKTIEESLKKVFFHEYNKWKNLFDLQIPSSLWMNDPSSVDTIHDKVINQIDNLAKLASTLVCEKNGKIESLVLGEEFHLNYKLNNNAILIGNIDLLARTNQSNKFRLIELKTGKRYPSDEVQLKIYGEVFRNSFPDYEIELELWHPYYKREIKKIIELEKDNEVLMRINELIQEILKIEKISDLPPEKENTYYCNNICKFCNAYLPKIFDLDIFFENY